MARKGYRRFCRLRYAALVIFVALAAIMGYGYVETFRLEVKEYHVACPDLPESFAGIRVALVSDIHRSPFFSQQRVRAVVDRVNSLAPDLVVLGGDYVYLGTKYADSCFTELARLHAPLGCFGVLGNHDYESGANGTRAGPYATVKAAKNAGITLLLDQGIWLTREGRRIRLAGVTDYSVDKPDLEQALGDAGGGDFVILVSHNPDFVEEIPAGVVDLVLSGHTHGGQITFFGRWAPYVPSDYGQKYRTGLISQGPSSVIVSNGIGTSTIPPIRLGARPQIVLVTLEHR
ncbi:MAG: metallophosphoesterase [Thermoleophilia bacterium]|nr:metallophosphoesterase [Thermoleophilia bacterium]